MQDDGGEVGKLLGVKTRLGDGPGDGGVLLLFPAAPLQLRRAIDGAPEHGSGGKGVRVREVCKGKRREAEGREGEGCRGLAAVVVYLGHGELEETTGGRSFAAAAPPSWRCSRGRRSEGKGWWCGVEEGRARGGFYSGRVAHGGRGAGAIVAGLGRRRPVEGHGWVAGLPGDRAGKAGRRGALGRARAHGPAVGVLGRRTACTSWCGRGVHGRVPVCCAGLRGSREARKEGGARHGRARRCHLGRPARQSDVRTAVPVAGVHTATPATIFPPPACSEVAERRGVQGWPLIDK